MRFSAIYYQLIRSQNIKQFFSIHYDYLTIFFPDNANLENVLDELLRDGEEPNQNNEGAAGEEANNEEESGASSEDSSDTSDMEDMSVSLSNDSDSSEDDDILNFI